MVKPGVYNNNNQTENLNENQMKANTAKQAIQLRLRLHEISMSKE